MSEPTLYGASSSRALRSIWAMEEVGVDYAHVPAQLLKESNSPEEPSDQRLIESASKELERPLSVLDAHLAKHETLLGDAFSVADLNVSAVMLLLDMIGHDHSPHTNVKRWVRACYARPSLAAAQARQGATQ